MARRRNPKLRHRLTEQAIDYVLEHGIGDLSLRPLAKALKTNARMLVYHFGSREQLMRAILLGLREREDRRIRQWFKTGRVPRTMSQFLRWYWQRASSRQARPAVRLIFELYGLALRHPEQYPGILESPMKYWQGLLDLAGLHESDPAEATLLLAAFRGLLLDICATGETSRVTAAMARLIEAQNRW